MINYHCLWIVSVTLNLIYNFWLQRHESKNSSVISFKSRIYEIKIVITACESCIYDTWLKNMQYQEIVWFYKNKVPHCDGIKLFKQ